MIVRRTAPGGALGARAPRADAQPSSDDEARERGRRDARAALAEMAHTDDAPAPPTTEHATPDADDGAHTRGVSDATYTLAQARIFDTSQPSREPEMLPLFTERDARVTVDTQRDIETAVLAAILQPLVTQQISAQIAERETFLAGERERVLAIARQKLADQAREALAVAEREAEIARQRALDARCLAELAGADANAGPAPEREPEPLDANTSDALDAPTEVLSRAELQSRLGRTEDSP